MNSKEIDVEEFIKNQDLYDMNNDLQIIIIGNKDKLCISKQIKFLNLSKLKCNTIIYMNQYKNSIKYHKLPEQLINLICSNNNLCTLPILPKTLEFLDCSFNRLTLLPNYLPEQLNILKCSNNKLSTLSNVQLPNSLTELYCINNNIEKINKLPSSLKVLHCYNNKLYKLPIISNTMESLYCWNNKIKNYPILPNLKEYYYYPLSYLSNLRNSLPEIPYPTKIVNYINISFYPN